MCALRQTPRLATLYSHRREDTRDLEIDTAPSDQAPGSLAVDYDDAPIEAKETYYRSKRDLLLPAASVVTAQDYAPASEGVLVLSDLVVGRTCAAAHALFRGDAQHLWGEEGAVQNLSCGRQHMHTTNEDVLSEYERRLAGAHLFLCLGFTV
jgi:hypothetical protein